MSVVSHHSHCTKVRTTVQFDYRMAEAIGKCNFPSDWQDFNASAFILASPVARIRNPGVGAILKCPVRRLASGWSLPLLSPLPSGPLHA